MVDGKRAARVDASAAVANGNVIGCSMESEAVLCTTGWPVKNAQAQVREVSC